MLSACYANGPLTGFIHHFTLYHMTQEQGNSPLANDLTAGLAPRGD